ncbi:MAG: GNAT family N-acetyltransferase [Casimicrobiaceae bacterium]
MSKFYHASASLPDAIAPQHRPASIVDQCSATARRGHLATIGIEACSLAAGQASRHNRHRMPSLSLHVTDTLASVHPSSWDALVGDRPLLSHAFLHALHETGCASPQTGWSPRYLLLRRGDALAGAMPLYLKAHSYGEYVFDWSWADAYRRHGRRYYPKLLAAIPFTPATGPRLLAATGEARRRLLDGALAMLAEDRVSSLHVLFPEADDAAECKAAGMMMRASLQFHWRNPGYRDFTDFLSTLNHAKRKKIRQERRKLVDAGISFRRLTAAELTSASWAFFFRCYADTYRAHGSRPYLTLPFFERIGATMPGNVVLVVGTQHGTPVCAALDVFNRDTLWGRYWGATAYVPGLHFEACYYQAIEFCIERGIGLFEGGAQGVHKLARGFLPVTTRSAHAIADSDFARAIEAFVARERADVAQTVDELERASPFRRQDPADPDAAPDDAPREAGARKA